MTQRCVVACRARFHQTFGGRKFIEAEEERVERTKFQSRIAPLQNAYRIVTMAFDARDQLLGKRFGIASNAECAVVHMAAGATGDLSHFFWSQRTHGQTVEFLQTGKRD